MGYGTNTALHSTQTGATSSPFIPEGDVPKRRSRADSRFHRIQPKIEEDIEMKPEIPPENLDAQTYGDPSRRSLSQLTDRTYAKEESVKLETDGVKSKNILRPCLKCRAKHIRCVHRGVDVKQKGKMLPVKNRPLASQQHIATSGKIKKDGILYKRNVHDRRTGPSMTPSAVDYRQRIVTEREYKNRMIELLDPDIVELADKEGGITPPGRLFKAVVRMLERVQEERAIRANLPAYQDAMEIDIQHHDGTVQDWKNRCLLAESKLGEAKGKIEALFRDM